MKRNAAAKGWLWAALLPAAFLLDRLTKLWAQGALAEGPRGVLPGFFRFVLVHNTGAAFGIFQGRPLLLALLTGVFLAGLLLFLILRRGRLSAWPSAALWLMAGGALGNLYDRLAHGYVIDFMEVLFIPFPVFNVADVCVVTAFIMLSGWILFGKEDAPDAR